MWYTAPYHTTVSVLPTHANHTIIGIFPKAGIMRLHKNNTSLKTNTILSHMLRKNLEVIVLLDLKKPTNKRKQILQFITVKNSTIFKPMEITWRSSWQYCRNVSTVNDPISKPQLLYTFSTYLSIMYYVDKFWIRVLFILGTEDKCNMCLWGEKKCHMI